MSTTSVLGTPTPTRVATSGRRIAAVVLLIIAIAAAAFVVGRTTVTTHASALAPAQFSSSLLSADQCRPHAFC